MVISGLGEQHLDVIVSKLKAKFGVEVTLEQPRVPYRETIRKKVQVQGRHKKQTGGHGQFGDVWIEFEPCDSEGLEFGAVSYTHLMESTRGEQERLLPRVSGDLGLFWIGNLGKYDI